MTYLNIAEGPDFHQKLTDLCRQFWCLYWLQQTFAVLQLFFIQLGYWRYTREWCYGTTPMGQPAWHGPNVTGSYSVTIPLRVHIVITCPVCAFIITRRSKVNRFSCNRHNCCPKANDVCDKEGRAYPSLRMPDLRYILRGVYVWCDVL